ncbi:BTB domain-containing protein [Mycena indigotica]|uniref:BTB domain-containing protein n=1 Tax=Mycena indigotica TaxID=2126181 RepID=A0A8H6TE99_9AGAR|nr:BTB domain-containing protein [Mycena indigotica]KAF7315146.1 BTB domain-containing protein [Mycena indigotica]
MSAFEAPPAKRPRTDDPPLEPTTITRSDIWHMDGSVILQALTTQFRVHWGLLTMHSTVFKDMYALPQPNASEPTVEGCPVVEVHDDPVDLQNLLKALYNPTYLLQDSLPFAVVAALIRLGRKYDFSDLFKAGVRRLTRDYPSTVEDFDCQDTAKASILPYHGLHVDVLALARENNILSVLPVAFYSILHDYRHVEWLDGLERPDGTKAVLAPNELRICVTSSSRMFRIPLQTGYTFSWLYESPSADICRCVTECSQWRLKISQLFINFNSDYAGAALFPDPDQVEVFLQSSCLPCQNEIRKATQNGRKKAWEDLPSFFGLPGWDELTNEV